MTAYRVKAHAAEIFIAHGLCDGETTVTTTLRCKQDVLPKPRAEEMAATLTKAGFLGRVWRAVPSEGRG